LNEMEGKAREAAAPPAPRSSAVIENRQRCVAIPLRRHERFLESAQSALGLCPGAVFIRLVGDREMARLNGAFRKKLKTTDVLSFPSETRSRPVSLRERARAVRGLFLGDIAIAPQTARRNAESYGRSFVDEMHILMLHGILHLLGYDHETDGGRMERLEMRLRRRLGLR